MTNDKLQLNFLVSLIFMTFIYIPDLFSQSNSVIGLTIEFSAPKGPTENADKVYLIKLDEDSKIIETKSVIRSKVQMDNQIYLTEIQPGRYAIVAIGKEKVLPIYGLTELTTYFSEELINENIITVDSNDFVFLGNYNVTTKMMVSNKKPDIAQLHYYKIITGNKRVPIYMRQVFLDNWHYRADLENLEINMTGKNDFFMKSLKHFEGLQQEEIIKSKIDGK